MYTKILSRKTPSPCDTGENVEILITDTNPGDYHYPATRVGHVKCSGQCFCYPKRGRREHRECGEFYEPKKGRSVRYLKKFDRFATTITAATL